MPRKPIVRSNEHYYHITARANNQEFFYLTIDKIWTIMTEELGKLQKNHDLKIASFVLMNNHFHMLLLSPKEDIDRVMYFFMKSVTLKIQRSTGRINKIFGGRYKGSIITNLGYMLNVYKYIYRNPIVVCLCEKAENYPYSSLYYQCRPYLKSPFEITPLAEEVDFEFSYKEELEWLNYAFLKEESESIRSGLKKTTFGYARDKSTNKIIEPEKKLQHTFL